MRQRQAMTFLWLWSLLFSSMRSVAPLVIREELLNENNSIMLKPPEDNGDLKIGPYVDYVEKLGTAPAFFAWVASQEDDIVFPSARLQTLPDRALEQASDPIRIDSTTDNEIPIDGSQENARFAYGIWKGEPVVAYINFFGDAEFIFHQYLTLQSLENQSKIIHFIPPLLVQEFGQRIQFSDINGQTCLVFSTYDDPLFPESRVFIVRSSLTLERRVIELDGTHAPHIYRLNIINELSTTPLCFKSILPFGREEVLFLTPCFDSPEHTTLLYRIPLSNFANFNNIPVLDIVVDSHTPIIVSETSITSSVEVKSFTSGKSAAVVIGASTLNNKHGAVCIINGDYATKPVITLQQDAFCLYSNAAIGLGAHLAFEGASLIATANNEIWRLEISTQCIEPGHSTIEKADAALVKATRIRDTPERPLTKMANLAGGNGVLMVTFLHGLMAYFILLKENNNESANLSNSPIAASGIILLSAFAVSVMGLLFLRSLCIKNRSEEREKPRWNFFSNLHLKNSTIHYRKAPTA